MDTNSSGTSSIKNRVDCTNTPNPVTIAGIILTNDIIPQPKLLEMLAQTDLPVVAAREDAYNITSKINNMTVKTQPQDTDKIPVIKRLITEHVDMKRLLAAF